MRKFVRQLRRAFTLIEMLFVIFIVGFLVCMLLPPFPHTSRERGRQADCMNNLKQIGLALNTYSQMNGGFYPYYDSPNATDSLALLYPDFMPAFQNFRCKSTSDSPAITVTLDANGKPISKTFGTQAPNWSSYGYDRTIGPRINPNMPVAADMDGTSVTNPDTVTANHRSGQNVLFYDGHVKWLQANTWDNNGFADNYYTADIAPAYEPDPPVGTITHYGDTDAYIQRP